MPRFLIVLMVVVLLTCLFAGTALAAPSQPIWEKLFGCEGILPIACPGPLPW